MIQKVAAMGSWWLAVCFITTMNPLNHHILAVFGETTNHLSDSPPPTAQMCALWFQAFPKTKSPLKGEETSDHQWDSGKYNRAGDGDWENCVRSQGAYFEGDWGIIVLCTMFLVAYIFFSKCLYFSCRMARYFLDRPHISKRIKSRNPKQILGF